MTSRRSVIHALPHFQGFLQFGVANTHSSTWTHSFHVVAGLQMEYWAADVTEAFSFHL